MTAMPRTNELAPLAKPVPRISVLGRLVESRLAAYADGRQVAYCDLGDSRGACTLFYFHSGGSSRLEAALGHEVAVARGIRLVCLDRPGAGRSTPLAFRSFSDPARDVANVADLLGIHRYVVAGFSAGAPHALAAVLAAPERVVGAIVVNTTGDRFHPAWRRQPLLTRAMFDLMLRERVWKFIWKQTLSRVRRQAAAGDAMAGALTSFLIEGGRQGSQATDHEVDLCYRAPWGLPLSMLARPVLALHGKRDPNLPFALALQGFVPSWRTQIVPGGHMDGASAQNWERICDAAQRFNLLDLGTRASGKQSSTEVRS